MLKFIFLMVLFVGISSGAFAQEFEVTGIIYEKPPLAIINGKILKVGDEIDGAVVQKIVGKAVFLKYKGDVIIKNVSGKRLPIEANVDENLDNEKHPKGKGRFSFFIFILILILSGAGFYLKGKTKKAKVE